MVAKACLGIRRGGLSTCGDTPDQDGLMAGTSRAGGGQRPGVEAEVAYDCRVPGFVVLGAPIHRHHHLARPAHVRCLPGGLPAAARCLLGRRPAAGHRFTLHLPVIWGPVLPWLNGNRRCEGTLSWRALYRSSVVVHRPPARQRVSGARLRPHDCAPADCARTHQTGQLEVQSPFGLLLSCAILSKSFELG